jgi:protein disulfide-isomerase A6
MWFSAILATSAASLLFPAPAVAAGLYTKNSPVIQVDANSYDRLIAKSNYVSVSDFDLSGDTSF